MIDNSERGIRGKGGNPCATHILQQAFFEELGVT
jgi:hypothetical protein